MFVLFLNIQAKDAFSFEPYEYPDSQAPDYMNPFFSNHRNSDSADFSIVDGAKWWHGSHSVMINMTHPGTSWNILAKNAWVSGEAEAEDYTFMDGLYNKDTIYYYLYIPWNCPVDSIFLMVRNENWDQDVHTIYHPEDLNFGRWNELKDGISDTCHKGWGDGPFNMPLIQTDLEIHLIAGSSPACTLYWDCPSSKGRVPFEYCDTFGQAGIEMPKPGDNPVKVAKTSINCIEYSLGVGALVMIQVFDLTGRKKCEMPIGSQSPGAYNIPLDLSSGVYFVKVTTDKNEGGGKIICVK